MCFNLLFKRNFKKDDKQELGLLGPDIKDNRDYQLSSVQKEAVVLPESFNLRDQMTSIQHQNWGTCTSHMADGIAEFSNSKEYNHEIKLSQKFIYYNTKKISGLWGIEGDYLRNALKAVCDYGSPLESDFPDVKRNSWTEYIKDVPTPTIYEKAEKYKGKTYWSVGSTLGDFRQAIYQQKAPVGFGMMWVESYRMIGQDGRLPLPSGNNIGGHAVVAVGWEKDKLWVRNSWGTSWGNSGYFYIPFDEFEEHEIWNAWVMLDIENQSETVGWVAGKYLKRVGVEFDKDDIVTPVYRLNLRSDPTVNSTKITTLNPGQRCKIIDGSILADGYNWWKIEILK